MNSDSSNCYSTGHAGFRLSYGVNPESLDDECRRRFMQLELDETTRAFIDRCVSTPHGGFKTWLHHLLRAVLSDFDVNGLLEMYPMHLLSTAAFSRLLGISKPVERALDVGAGNGDVSSELLALVHQLHVSEQSWAMRWRLRARGFTLVRTDLENAQSDYDLVSCLNVLDRTRNPATLLRALSKRVAHGGKLILSVPLPLDPFFYHGRGSSEPEEPLPATNSGWEESLNRFAGWLRELLPGFKFVVFSRTPYLSGGDAARTLYVLDACVLVFERLESS